MHDFDRIAVEVEHGSAVVASGLVTYGRLAMDTAARFERGGEESVYGGARWCGESDVCGAGFVPAPLW